MRVCGFRQLASSALLPGNLLEGLLESMLERSMRRTVARRSKRGPGRACNWRDQAEKLRIGIGKSSPTFLVFVTVIVCNTMAIAQDYRGSAEQRAACTPDAFRLCASYIPDATKVDSCLRQQKSELSEACRSVFEQNAGPVASSSR
jgi:hypothetical protein